MAEEMLWIGLVGVRPRDGNAFLGGARGAFVRLLAMARDESHYLLQMRQTLEEFRFDFDEVTAVEPYAEFVSREGMAVDLSEVADKVSRDGYTRFGEFFAYEADDA